MYVEVRVVCDDGGVMNYELLVCLFDGLVRNIDPV